MTNSVTNVAQVAVGSGLILFAMLSNAAPLGGLALLPLIGIVPIIFGLYGVQSPVCRLVTKAVNAARKQTENAVTPSAA